ncbi:MAG TPA: DUF3536 domain-containing protein [Gemmatimonadales bacterium]|nr:DUF3536 domain-containing protein [Gemmatimonadales bacterium]
MTSIIIHGHYYQPPRENPWLEEVEVELSAAPFHDWNQRIERECYRAVEAARVLGRTGHIAQMINTLAWTSFNFGPTLLTWLETAAPVTYQQMLEADRDSVKRFGVGNALAHPYHHVILPLSTRRDKVTEVRWGIADFRRRFGREPEGMWLPETAVDEETLDVLAEEGIQFTILAPHQAKPLPPNGRPGLYRTRSGRTIALCFYDGGLSQEVAFGELIRDANLWVGRMAELASIRPGGIVATATDGETFGHHHKFGEMALAHVIREFGAPPAGGPDIRLESFAARLARAPATDEVQLIAPTSWSCPHGVERWRSECGCKLEPSLPTQQKWRAVLRDAMNWLAAQLHEIYEREGPPLLGDVWAARNRYDPHLESAQRGGDLRSRELLEMERHALLLFTSCAWFFDDIARIEPVQVLKYAARAIELAGAQGPRLEAGLLERLAKAQSNDRAEGSGRQIYLTKVKPVIPEEARHAAGLAALVAAGVPVAEGRAAGYEGEVAGDGTDVVRVHLTQRRTGREFKATVRSRDRRYAVSAESDYPGTAPRNWIVEEAALWDRHLLLIKREQRRALVATALSSGQLFRLANGDTGLADAAREALVEALGTLTGTAGGLPRVKAALDLLDQLGEAVPFDAQARFAALIRSGIPTRLKPLAERLGFEAE